MDHADAAAPSPPDLAEGVIDLTATPDRAGPGQPRRDAWTGNVHGGRRRAGVWTYRGLIWNFAVRDLRSRYKGTALGWAWSFMVPIATIVIYSVVFSVVIRVQPPPFGDGTPGVYAVWLIAGMTTWAFLSNVIIFGMPALLGNGPLLQKVYIPSYVPVMASAIAVAIQSLIELTIVLVILAAFGNIGWTWLLVPFWVVLLLVFGAGASYCLAVGNVFVRDLGQIIGVAMQLLFFLSPVIYPITLVPEMVGPIPVRSLVAANPLAQFVMVGRDLMYSLELPSLGEIAYLGLWTVGVIGAAWLIYRRWGQDVGEAI